MKSSRELTFKEWLRLKKTMALISYFALVSAILVTLIVADALSATGEFSSVVCSPIKPTTWTKCGSINFPVHLLPLKYYTKNIRSVPNHQIHKTSTTIFPQKVPNRSPNMIFSKSIYLIWPWPRRRRVIPIPRNFTYIELHFGHDSSNFFW